MFNYNKLGGSDSPNIDLSENPFNWPVDDDGRVQDSPNINLSEQFHQAFFLKMKIESQTTIFRGSWLIIQIKKLNMIS